MQPCWELQWEHSGGGLGAAGRKGTSKNIRNQTEFVPIKEDRIESAPAWPARGHPVEVVRRGTQLGLGERNMQRTGNHR